MNTDFEKCIADLLTSLGEDPKREGLNDTPRRYLKALEDITCGYRQSVHEIINGAIYEVPYSEMVIVRNIEVYSLCEHHLLPFFGKCQVAYLPKGRVIGLSKIPRLVDMFSRRLQVQERLTTQIADCLMEHLRPAGVGVVMEAYHLCMMMRGVRKENSFAQTSALHGEFQKSSTRLEFFNLIK